MAIKYVDDFEFPAEAGFTGSAGVQSVRGYQRGGRVKASPQFRMKTGKQDPMDHGVQPARRGRNQAEIEAGGTKRLLPGFKRGGQANAEMYKHGGKMGFKKGVQHKYAEGGQVLSGQSRDNQRRNTVAGTSPSEGAGVQPVGRGKINVGSGGSVGSHRGFRYAKGGIVNQYRTNDPGGYEGAMRNRGKGVTSGK